VELSQGMLVRCHEESITMLICTTRLEMKPWTPSPTSIQLCRLRSTFSLGRNIRSRSGSKQDIQRSSHRLTRCPHVELLQSGLHPNTLLHLLVIREKIMRSQVDGYRSLASYSAGYRSCNQCSQWALCRPLKNNRQLCPSCFLNENLAQTQVNYADLAGTISPTEISAAFKEELEDLRKAEAGFSV